jgi:hypothetical protein
MRLYFISTSSRKQNVSSIPELKQSGNPKISKPAMESAIGQVK